MQVDSYCDEQLRLNTVDMKVYTSQLKWQVFYHVKKNEPKINHVGCFSTFNVMEQATKFK